RDRTLGAVTLVAAESGHRYTADDLALARELGRRAALAVDNARLFHESADALRRLGVLVEASARFTGSLDVPAVPAASLDPSHRAGRPRRRRTRHRGVVPAGDRAAAPRGGGRPREGRLPRRARSGTAQPADRTHHRVARDARNGREGARPRPRHGAPGRRAAAP